MHKSRVAPQKKARPSGKDKNQLGIFAVPDFGMDEDDEDDNDDDLEAELNAILASGGGAPRPKPKPKAAISDLESMVAASMQDIPSDAELSGDDDDPELLAEFNSVLGEETVETPTKTPEIIAPTSQSQDFVNVLLERIEMYRTAEEIAKTSGDALKLRRLARGLKTLEDLLKKAKAGFAINESDIPLPVSVAASKPKAEEPPPQIFEPIPIDGDGPTDSLVQPQSSEVKEAPLIDLGEPDDEKKEILKTLNERKELYKTAAVVAKRNGDLQTAISYVKTIKQFETVIAAVESGHPFDLSNMPGPPSGEIKKPTSEDNSTSISAPSRDPQPIPEVPMENETVEGPKTPETILEALEQRLAKYKESEEAGTKDGNAGKVRRMRRIIKQYEDAIKLHKAGKPIPIEDLPTPPGFAPIPVPSAAGARVPPTVNIPTPEAVVAPRSPVGPPRSPVGPPRSPVAPPRAQKVAPAPPVSPGVSSSSTSSSQSGSVTRQEKQLAILRLKQRQFKESAVKAKQSGNIELAKELLRKVKCFDPLIEATISGLPVDMSTLPAPPGSKDAIEKEYEIVKLQDCLPGTTSEIYNQLITDLHNQLKTCMETRAHYKALGDVANANKFENLAVNTKKDLDTVKIASNKDDPVPRFHYELRTFSIIKSNTDLTDNDLELTIVQGVNYNVPNPKEIDTYIRYEFPYPSDDPPKDKTSTIYNTNNPAYNAVVSFPIQRSNRACQRIFKRQSIKLEVWSKGFVLSALCRMCSKGDAVVSGFLRSDVLIGTVTVKLLPLETKCTIHDSFDLMNGKKVVGGKLEVKVRLRHPIATKQFEQIKEKWLVID